MLSKRDIFKELGKNICIYPLHIKNIKENSINLTIGQNAWIDKNCKVKKIYQLPNDTFSLKKEQNSKELSIIGGNPAIIPSMNSKKKFLILLPHTTTSVETSEVIAVSQNIGGTFHSKVGIAAKGVGHIGTMLGPCYCGHLLISLHNITDNIITLEVGETFISLIFYLLETPIQENVNSNYNGHVDKFSELRFNVSQKTREYLTEDWKSSFTGIRNKMLTSDAYIQFKKTKSRENIEYLKRYLNIRNIIIILLIISVFILSWFGVHWYDNKNGTTVWSERYWEIIITAVIVPILLNLYKLFKRSNE